MTLRPNDYDRNGDIIPMGWKEENGDLISRSVLKEELKKLNKMLLTLTDEKDKQSVRFAINILQDLIDNATTIEPITSQFHIMKNEIRWTDKVFLDSQGNIRSLDGCPTDSLTKELIDKIKTNIGCAKPIENQENADGH